MKSAIACFLFLIIFSTGEPSTHELQWKGMEKLGFGLSIDDYEVDSIYFFHALLDKKDHLNEGTSNSTFSFSNHAQPLDLYNYWNTRNDEKYNILFTKTAYVLNQSMDFFSENRLSNPEFIAKTMPSAKINKTDSVYHLAFGFGIPDIDYTLRFYTNDQFDLKHPLLNDYFSLYDGLELKPGLIVIQHNFNYSRVMFQKTSKMSVSISRYFSASEEKTLVFNYTLNYIHNMPPALLGGSDFLLDKIKEGIQIIIEETQYLCENAG